MPKKKNKRTSSRSPPSGLAPGVPVTGSRRFLAATTTSTIPRSGTILQLCTAEGCRGGGGEAGEKAASWIYDRLPSSTNQYPRITGRCRRLGMARETFYRGVGRGGASQKVIFSYDRNAFSESEKFENKGMRTILAKDGKPTRWGFSSFSKIFSISFFFF